MGPSSRLANPSSGTRPSFENSETSLSHPLLPLSSSPGAPSREVLYEQPSSDGDDADDPEIIDGHDFSHEYLDEKRPRRSSGAGGAGYSGDGDDELDRDAGNRRKGKRRKSERRPPGSRQLTGFNTSRVGNGPRRASLEDFDDDLDTEEKLAFGTGSPRITREASRTSSGSGGGSAIRRKPGEPRGDVIVPDLNPSSLASSKKKGRPGSGHGAHILVGLVILFVGGYLLSYLVVAGTRYGHELEVNVILMISDGFGPASETYSRSFLQYLHSSRLLHSSGPTDFNSTHSQWMFDFIEQGFTDKDGLGLAGSQGEIPTAKQKVKGGKDSLKGKYGKMPLDEILVGSSRTRSSNSLITDSAAGATAFSCGIKTYNGGIAVSPKDKSPCGTILEAASHLKYHTGLVTTSRITHATPASFYSHVVDRDLEDDIATFLVGLGPLGLPVDVAFGGGRCHFLKGNGDENCRRKDGKDLIEELTKRGGEYLNDWERFDKLDDKGRTKKGKMRYQGKGLPLVGLFSDDHMNYEMDRRMAITDRLGGREPSLKEMSIKAINILSSLADKGFFLMIEGARIDMAAHSNDPIGHLGDILAYQEAVAAVKQWVENENRHGKPTLLISVSDHETGGLALGRQLDPNKYPDYLWYPDALMNSTRSTAYLGMQLANQPDPVSEQWVKDEILAKGLGVKDGSSDEITKLIKGRDNAYRNDRLLADMISRRAQIGWSTSGHSGVDVNLYADGHKSDALKGNIENTGVGEFIRRIMDLDTDHITYELNRNLKAWFSNESRKHPGGIDAYEVAHYHGDF